MTGDRLEMDDGVELRVQTRGSSGSTIVLVHGWKGSHRLWDPVVARLSDRYRLVAYDLRGMGDSDKPPGWDIDRHARDLAAVASASGGDDVTVVGWSMGCTVVLHALDGHLVPASRAVLVNGPLKLEVTDDFPHALPRGAVAGLLDELRMNWPAGERAFIESYFHKPNDEVVDWLMSIARQTPLDIALAALSGQSRLDQREAVARVEVPLLAAYGSLEKHWLPGLPRYIAQSAPRGHLVLFEASAHCPPLEEPDAFCSALEHFIKNDSA